MLKVARICMILPFVFIVSPRVARADSITAGGPLKQATCLLFGCSGDGTYQQVSAASLFRNVFDIRGVFGEQVSPVPEPGSLLLVGSGLCALGARARHRIRGRLETFRASSRRTIRYFLSRDTFSRHHAAGRPLRQGCALLAGVLLAAPAYAGADSIIFSNLGPGGTYDPGTAYNVSGPLSQAEEASAIGQPFVPTADFAFDAVEVALNWLLDTNAGAVSLMSDLGGQPGSVLESFQFANRPHLTSTDTDLAQGLSLQHPLLHARTQYWIVATAEGDAFMVWNFNNTGQLGTAIRINDEEWTARPDLSSAAFRVRGSRVENVVAEPTSLLLLGTAAIGLIARRRSRTPDSHR